MGIAWLLSNYMGIAWLLSNYMGIAWLLGNYMGIAWLLSNYMGELTSDHIFFDDFSLPNVEIGVNSARYSAVGVGVSTVPTLGEMVLYETRVNLTVDPPCGSITRVLLSNYIGRGCVQHEDACQMHSKYIVPLFPAFSSLITSTRTYQLKRTARETWRLARTATNSASTPGSSSYLLGLGLTVRYSAVGVGVNSAVQCGWGWG